MRSPAGGEIGAAPPVADEASRFRGSASIGGYDSARQSVGTTVGKRAPPLRTTKKPTALLEKVSLRSQFANWLWQSASPVLSPPLPKGDCHGEAVTGGFFTSPPLLQHFRMGDPCGRPWEGKSAKRRQWRMKQAGFEEVPRLAGTTVPGNRSAQRWAREPLPYAPQDTLS